MQYGFFENVELISKTEVQVLTKYPDECHAVFAPYANASCERKWGQRGEDVFVQRCADHQYLDNAKAFDVTTDVICIFYLATVHNIVDAI